ncbi:hypothetical protein [Actinacidiphila acididurans]|uniref:Uncharacterized protein n=1 Tax=Actinacidiphila acididurans TaxID=2784346 RepID=A0ABS2TX00_9ACTN|nr:hypothetical protein [Actinacidiphila acididurans]MBM9507870.1 hypothetical protein [Actinacidiphila acididurans]
MRLGGPLRTAGVSLGTAYGEAVAFPDVPDFPSAAPGDALPADTEGVGDPVPEPRAAGFPAALVPPPPPHPDTAPTITATVETATRARPTRPPTIPHP